MPDPDPDPDPVPVPYDSVRNQLNSVRIDLTVGSPRSQRRPCLQAITPSNSAAAAALDETPTPPARLSSVPVPLSTFHPRPGSLAVVAVGLGVLLASGSCRRADDAPTAAAVRPNVLVITLDTIRADRLGAYGNRRVQTPFIDSLAERGVLFERCVAPTPLTLPSHTSLFTGTYPAFHGVRDNGNSIVPAELTTMAELLADAGYRAAGFVGAYVLAARWGLDQGFDSYTEPASGFDPDLASFAQIQRPADEVVDDALAWLADGSATPFFAWIHLYDPHLPYDPPHPYATDYADEPYLGEIAFADAQLARIGAFLGSSGLDRSTLIVFAGDHGEGLGDHGELDHGLLLYQTTVRTPLIIVNPRAPVDAVRRPEPVSLVDVLPTVAEAVGLPIPAYVQGRNLLPLITGAGVFDEAPLSAETRYPLLHFGWSPLASLQDRRYQFIRSAEPELYDLERDPGQTDNLASSHPEIVDHMARQLEELETHLGHGGLDASSTPDAATVARLQALGYLAGGAAPVDEPAAGDLPDPKRMLGQYNRLMEASATLASGDAATGERMLRELLGDNDDLVDAWVALGRLYRRQGRLAESLAALREAHDRRPFDPFLVPKLADALISTRRLDEAEELLRGALTRHPDDPSMTFTLARVLDSAGRSDEADAMFCRTLDLDPQSAPAHVRLAAIALRRGDSASAEAELETALRIDPRVPDANLLRGQLLETEGRLDDAARAYREELAALPNSLPAALALSRLEGHRGHFDEQERVLRDAIRVSPRSPGPYLVLALTLLQRGERLDEAVQLAEQGLERHPEGRELQMAYVLLANLHGRLGEPDRAAEYAQMAEQMQ